MNLFKNIITLHFLFLLLCPNILFAQSNEILCKGIDDIAQAEMRTAEKRISKGYYKTSASELIDVVYHRCEWEIDPAVRALSGKVTTYYRYLSNSNEVTFDLADTMIVDSVLRMGNSLAFSRSDNTVKISLPRLMAQNSLDSLSIYYHGVPPSSGFGSFSQTTHAGKPVLWTLSEPYGARDWWPCKNTLDDKIDSIDIFISCPVGNKGISNGLRQSVIVKDMVETSHWKHRYPIVSYLVCFAVTNYTEFNKTVQLGDVSLPMQTFCYPESYDLFSENTQSTLDAMQLFHVLFGDYPFIKEKYGHTQFSWGGGEEHQTNSFVINPGESLCAHELAHQWFGDKITCGSWEDIWLNEGFATHLASMHMESKYPDSVLVWRKREIDRITTDNWGAVKVDDTNNVYRIFSSRLSYTKGSHLLYMLRFMLGTDVFLKAVRNYLNDPKLSYGFAKTADLKKHLEVASGQKLDSFFRQWYEGEGYPSYQLQWAQIGTGTVKFRLSQEASHSSVSFFEMPVPIKFQNATQEKTIIVDLKKNSELSIQDIGFVADTAIIDPEYWLISRNNKSTKLDDLEPRERNLLVFPNPFSESFAVQIQNFEGPSISLQIFNLLGQKIYEQQYPLYKGKAFISIPAAHWSKGKYLLKITNHNGTENVLSLLKD